MNNQKFIYLLCEINTRETDDNIIAASDSVAALINEAICASLIDEDTAVQPTQTARIYCLGDYLPNWKTKLCLLSKSEFNDWFHFDGLQILEAHWIN